MSTDEETVKPAKAADEESRPPAAVAADDENVVELTEQDSRPFFFRHVTAIVKVCAVLLIAGRSATCFGYMPVCAD